MEVSPLLAGRPVKGLGKIDTGGALNAFDAGLDGSVNAIFLSGGNVYFGGSFDTAGGALRRNVAAFTTAGALQPWDPSANSEVVSLSEKDGVFYMGGLFDTLGGVARSFVGAVDTGGNLTSWNPGLTFARDSEEISVSSVNDFVFNEDIIYVGGSFTSIGGAARNSLAALDAAGNTLSWDPNSNSTVKDLLLVGENIFVAGSFGQIGGKPRSNFTSIDTAGSPRVYASHPQ